MDGVFDPSGDTHQSSPKEDVPVFRNEVPSEPFVGVIKTGKEGKKILQGQHETDQVQSRRMT